MEGLEIRSEGKEERGEKEYKEDPSIRLSAFASLFDKQEWSDVVFLVKEMGAKTPKKIFANRAILASRSETFSKMFFSGNFREGTSNQVEIPTISYQCFYKMLQFIYTGYVELDSTCVFEMLDVANQYGISSLKDNCSHHIEMNINPEDVCSILEAADLFNCSDLIVKARDFILENASQVFRLPSLGVLSKANFISLLKEERISAPELTVFEGVALWGNTHPQELSEVIPLVRFPLIDANALVDIVQSKGLVPLELLLEAHIFHSTGRIAKENIRGRKRLGTIAAIKWNKNGKGDGITLVNNIMAQLSLINQRQFVRTEAPLILNVHYWEVVCEVVNGCTQLATGIATEDANSFVNPASIGETAHAWVITSDRKMMHKGTILSVNEWKNGDIIGVKVDMDHGTLTFYQNGNKVGTFTNCESEWSNKKLYPIAEFGCCSGKILSLITEEDKLKFKQTKV